MAQALEARSSVTRSSFSALIIREQWTMPAWGKQPSMHIGMLFIPQKLTQPQQGPYLGNTFANLPILLVTRQNESTEGIYSKSGDGQQKNWKILLIRILVSNFSAVYHLGH